MYHTICTTWYHHFTKVTTQYVFVRATMSRSLSDKLCFNTFFHNEDMQEITKHFVVCHVDAPGQHIGAPQMPQGCDECTYIPV